MTLLDKGAIIRAAQDVPGVGACVVYVDHRRDAVVIKNYFGVHVLIDWEVIVSCKHQPAAAHALIQREVRRALEGV